MKCCNSCNITTICELILVISLFHFSTIYSKWQIAYFSIKLNCNSISRTESFTKLNSILIWSISNFSQTIQSKSIFMIRKSFIFTIDLGLFHDTNFKICSWIDFNLPDISIIFSKNLFREYIFIWSTSRINIDRIFSIIKELNFSIFIISSPI